MKHGSLIVLFLTASALGIAVFGYNSRPLAHSGAKGVVKERMELMERHDELLDRIFAMIHGELPYSEKAVRAAAREIKETSGQHMVKLFPAGSTQKPSAALPVIWKDFDRFTHMAERLRDFAEALERSASEKPSSPSSLPKKWEQVPAMGGAMGRGGGMMGQGGMMRGQGMMGNAGEMPRQGGMMQGRGMMGQGTDRPGQPGAMQNQGTAGRGMMMGGGGVEGAVQRVAHMCNNCHNIYRKNK